VSSVRRSAHESILFAKVTQVLMLREHLSGTPNIWARHGDAGLRSRRHAGARLSYFDGKYIRVRRPRHGHELREKLENGVMQLYCVDSVDEEALYNNGRSSARPHRAPHTV